MKNRNYEQELRDSTRPQHDTPTESWVLWLTLPVLFLAWIIIRGVMTYFGV